ncbi:MAG: methyltransferase domain-containing protein [Desulfobaccales bacterium]
MILPFNNLNISSSDLVLEVGSGHRPTYRADVLCDKYLTNEERGGDLVKDRPIFAADCHSLPFVDKAFDYIICNQVLEHVHDPLKCCSELSRIGRRGYIETPSMIWEMLHPSRKYHRWFVLLVKGTLVFYSKEKAGDSSLLGNLFDIMYSNSLEYHLFFRAFDELFTVRHEWHDHIDCVVDPTDDELGTLCSKPWGPKEYSIFCKTRTLPEQVCALTTNVCWTTLLFLLYKPRELLGRVLRYYRNRRLRLDLANLLACPQCLGSMIISSSHMKCVKCGAAYEYRDGIPCLIPEAFCAEDKALHLTASPPLGLL